MRKIKPSAENQVSMWRLMEKLFPHYRSLCGPDFAQSLDLLGNWLDFDVIEVPSGSAVGEWTVPDEFFVKEAWVEDPAGNRHLDFHLHPYHLWIYSQPFEGIVEKEELLKKIDVMPHLPSAIPLRQTYYRNDWGFCASVEDVERLPDGPFKVNIVTELNPGVLRIGEVYLPGESDQEILIDSYLCHPRGANDNLSGVAVSVELFRLLAQLPNRKRSYRLAIWPETIGPIAWINTQPEKLAKLIGGFEISICGDASPLTYVESFYGDGITDRAVRHVAEHRGSEVRMQKYLHFKNGSNQGHFNMPSIRLPYGRLARSGAGTESYPEYHSSADDLDVVRPEHLQDTLEFLWETISTIDRCHVWTPTYEGTPFLSGHGVYPYQHSIGRGETNSNDFAQTYYELMGSVDGKLDLLEIADRCNLPIGLFDEAVEKFEEAGLIQRQP